jgi:TonB family protein
MPMPKDFQLGLLPEHKINWRSLVTSYGLLVLFILFLINLAILVPQKLNLSRDYHITEIIPIPALRPEPPPPPPVTPPPVVHAKLLPPAPVAKPKLTVPKEIREAQEKPKEIEPPKVALNTFTPTVLKPAPGGARPMLIHTGDFGGSSAPPTVNAPVKKVQTGGFGDPNGLNGQGKPNAKLIAANTGSFDMPQGAGYGNGSGGAKGIRGTVASADFGNGIATSGNGDGRSSGRGNVQTGGFGAQEVAQVTKTRQLDSGPPTNPVEITFKPNPAYTDEARQLKLEGEVLLEVMFGANGQLRVNRVVRGLGHGLDEAAVAAANKIRFKAALRDGQPVDSTAIVHVVFQLAY